MTMKDETFTLTTLLNKVYFRDDECIEVYDDEDCYNEECDTDPLFTLMGRGTLRVSAYCKPQFANAKVGFCKPMGDGVYRVWLMLGG